MSTFTPRLLAIALLLPAAASATTRVIFGTDSPAVAQVRVADAATGSTAMNFFPYGPNFTGGVRVAMGDLTGDGTADLLTAAGPGGNGHIKVFDGATGQEIRSFFAFPGFGGEVYGIFADISGDGISDIVVGAGPGSTGGHVKVFDGRNNSEIRNFFAFPGFVGGVRVAGADVNGDGRADIIVGLGPGTVAQVRVFDGLTSQQLRAITPFPGFQGGVFVSGGDLDGDGRGEILVATDGGAAGHVKAFGASDLTPVREFFPYASSFMGGVRVAFGDLTGDGVPDLVMAAGPGAALNAVVRPGPGFSASFNLTPFAPDYSGGTFVGTADQPDVLLANGFE
jgi:trimeric autotransporter adhesin